MRHTGWVYDPEFLKHETGRHPERPDRLSAICKTLHQLPNSDQLLSLDAQVQPHEWITQLHTPVYLTRLRRACESGLPHIDCPDSAICPESYHVAKKAVAMVLGACDAVATRKVQNAFCAVRPPGHHAETDRSMGFCLFNNIAVAARYLQQKHGLKQLFIVDWDVHHGNGTQHLFEEDPFIFYASLHQHPATCYPGTGWPDEHGRGPGEGTTLNIPVEPGTTDGTWIDNFRNQIIPAAEAHKPDMILISAGFDAHHRDPLAQVELTEEAYREMTRELCDLAKVYCQGRVLSVLEGGYDLEALASSAAVHVSEMCVT